MGTEPVRVGLAFNTRRTSSPEVDDREAEFDTPETIGAIADAIASHGYEVVELELDEAFPNALVSAKVDLVFNIAEGSRGRMRESLVPALCEFHGIPVTGSDGATLAICLDKDLTKRVLRGTIERSRVAEELRLPDYRVFDEAMPRELDLRFPVIVKPIGEGSSKGVFPESVAFDEAGVRRLVGEIVRRYEQPAIVEEYITGREVTVGILGNRDLRVLPPVEVLFAEGQMHPVFDYALKLNPHRGVRLECPARLSASEREVLERVASFAFRALGCRDFARLDMRLAPDGSVYLLEVNPLPGLSVGRDVPDSDLVLCAKAAGLDHRALIGEILSCCVERTGLGRQTRSSRAGR